MPHLPFLPDGDFDVVENELRLGVVGWEPEERLEWGGVTVDLDVGVDLVVGTSSHAEPTEKREMLAFQRYKNFIII